MAAPLPIGRAEHCDCTEGKKHRAKNVSIPRPGGDCAGQRQEGEQSEVARLGVHFRPPDQKGQRPGCPSPVARVDGLEPRMRFPPRANGRPSFWERPSYALPDRRRKASRGDANRPRPVGGVNWLVKTLTLTREITGGMLRAARC